MQILKMTLQVAYKSKFLESFNINIYCAECTAYTWQSAVETKLCWRWKPASWGCFKGFLFCCLYRQSVWGVGPALPCSPDPLCALVPQQTDAQGALRRSGDCSRSEPTTASSSVCPCMCVLGCLCPLRRVKAFPLGVQLSWEVSRSPSL